MKKLISTTLFLIGLILLSYPALSQKYLDYKQKQLLENYQKELLLNIDPDAVSSIQEDSVLFAGESISDLRKEMLELHKLYLYKSQEEERLQKIEKVKQEEKRQKYISSITIGILKIPKINLCLPILNDDKPSNLNISPSKINNSYELGLIGNLAIAGHRSKTYGRHFNRLDELQVGDLIEFQDKNKTYNYKINDKFIVSPEETWVLNSNNKDSEITLITCTPMNNPTHRLVIKGILEPIQ